MLGTQENQLFFSSFISLLYHTLTRLLVTSLWLTITLCAQATSTHNDARSNKIMQDLKQFLFLP